MKLLDAIGKNLSLYQEMTQARVPYDFLKKQEKEVLLQFCKKVNQMHMGEIIAALQSEAIVYLIKDSVFLSFLLKLNCEDKHHMKSMGKNLQEDAAPIKYLRLLLRYLEPEDKRSEWEKDVWKLENFGFEVRQNPIDVIRTIKFTGIIQETIREEVKRASYIRIKYLSVGSLQGEIRAVRRFSEFLAKRNPEIKSLGEVGRLNIEEYLTYINLERGQERNLKTEMANLKNMLQQVGKVIDKPKLGKLFIKQDMPKAPEVAFKIYSDEEIKRLNYYIVNMEEQVARALILHQMLGGRISDTLTLRTDCLYQENGHYIVRMYQVKTSYYEKPIPDDVAKLIQKSMEYTYERYGETEYVFVNESNPSLPFQYSMLKHRVYTLIHENDICKDNGERMGFATHLFRHCYGMKLVELHLDDAAIAHLLGHRGVKTLKLDIPLVPETRIKWALMPLHIAKIYILKLCLDEEIIPRCRFPCSRGYLTKCINRQKKQ